MLEKEIKQVTNEEIEKRWENSLICPICGNHFIINMFIKNKKEHESFAQCGLCDTTITLTCDISNIKLKKRYKKEEKE